MKDLIQKTIARLKKEKMKPLPKWRFVLTDVAYWTLVGLAVLFSAVAVAAGIYLLFQIDWEVVNYGSRRALPTVLSYIPYVWLAVTAILIGAVFYFIRKTKEGYKYKWVVVLFSSLSLILAIGAVAHFAKIGEIADDFAYRRVPLYKNFAPGMEHMWQRAEEGFLAGTVSSIESDKIVIIDPRGKKWEVFISEKTVRRGPFGLEEGGWVKVVGKSSKGNVFDAQAVITGGDRMMRGFDGREARGGSGMMRGPGRGWE